MRWGEHGKTALSGSNEESLLRRRRWLATSNTTDQFRNMPKQLVKTVVALCPDQQEKGRTGKNAQKWKTEGYVCSMLSLFQFQFLYHQEKEKKKKEMNSLAQVIFYLWELSMSVQCFEDLVKSTENLTLHRVHEHILHNTCCLLVSTPSFKSSWGRFKKKKNSSLIVLGKADTMLSPPLCFTYVLINLFWRREGMGPKKNEESVSLSFAKKMFKTLVLD